jgi:hypothetical protein
MSTRKAKLAAKVATIKKARARKTPPTVAPITSLRPSIEQYGGGPGTVATPAVARAEEALLLHKLGTHAGQEVAGSAASLVARQPQAAPPEPRYEPFGVDASAVHQSQNVPHCDAPPHWPCGEPVAAVPEPETLRPSRWPWTLWIIVGVACVGGLIAWFRS